MNLSTAVGRLRAIGLAEGVSALVLFFIAMPLKYLAGKPEVVRWVGWAHGVLFIAFMAAVVYVFFLKKWKLRMVVLAFIAALVPFGTFWFDKKIRQA